MSGSLLNSMLGIGGGFLNDNLLALAGLDSVSGLLVQTAESTFTKRTLTGTADRISVADGNGVAGNPTIDIASTYIGQTSITTLGTITTGTWGASTIAANKGGTGIPSYAIGDILYADTPSTLARLADVATGNALISGGVTTAPAWGKIGLATHISGVLPIANGGTNATSQTANGICYYDGSNITTSLYAALSFIAGDVDFLVSHPSVSGTAYEVLVTSSSCQYLMAYNTVSTFQGICGTAATENYWTLSTKGLGLSVSAAALWFGSTSNDDLQFYRNNTERLRLTSTGIYVPDAISVGTTSALGRIYTVDETATPGRWYFDQYRSSSGVYSGATFRKARGTKASPTTIINGDTLGSLEWYGYDGAGFIAAASILGVVDSTAGTNDMPTALTFRTTADGASSTTEAGRFTSNQTLNIGSSVPTINAMGSGTSLIQANVRLISGYSASAGGNNYFLGSGNDGGLLQVFGCAGTLASPTAITTGGRLGGFFGRGYAATGYSNAIAAIEYYADSTFTDTSTPSYITFATTASGATTRTEAMRITSSGNLLLGTTSTSARITLGGSPVMQTLIRNDAVLTASGTNANQYGFINYNNMTFISGSSNYATGHYADLKVNVPGGATVIDATSIIAVAPTNLGGGSVTHAKAFRANAPSVGASSNIAAYLENVSIGSGFTNTTPPTNGALIQGNVAIATTDTSRRLVVAGVGGLTNDKLLYLRQNNDYGYSFNLDSFSTGRLWIKGVNNGIETDIMTLDRTNGYVGIGTTSPSWRLVVNESQGYSSRAANPVPAQIAVQSGNSGYLRLGNFYTGGIGTCSTIQSTDYFSGADHGTNLLLNPLGGNVGIGEDTPNFTLVARYTGSAAQISARYNGTSPSNAKELLIGYDIPSGDGFGWIQGVANGIAYTPLVLQRYDGNVGIGKTDPQEKLDMGSGKIRFYSGSDYQNVYGGTWGLNIFASKLSGSLMRLGEYNGNLGIWVGDGATGYNFAIGTPSGKDIYLSPANSTTAYFLSGGAIGFGGSPSLTNGYFTRLDVNNGTTGPVIRIQESSGSGRGHIQIGASSTATNNVHIGCEGNGAFYVWNGVFGGGVQRFVVDATGNMATSNTSGLNYYAATGVSGSYIQLGNSNAGGYSTQLIHSGIHSILQNGAGGSLYFRTYTANYAAIVGEMILDSSGNFVVGPTSALATNATSGFIYIRTCAGTPTGVPAVSYAGHVAMLYDTTNNKLWAYNGAWKGVVLS